MAKGCYKRKKLGAMPQSDNRKTNPLIDKMVIACELAGCGESRTRTIIRSYRKVLMEHIELRPLDIAEVVKKLEVTQDEVR